MAKQVQFRRGTTSQLSSVTGQVGELFVDTDKDTLTVHDGYQAGGFPLLREDLNNLASQGINPLTKLGVNGGTAGQILKVNAAADAMEWGAANNASDLTTGTLPWAQMGPGSIVQLQSRSMTNTNSFSGYSWHNTDNYVYITPRFADSKILVMFSTVMSISGSTTWMGRITRNGTVPSGSVGNASGNRPQAMFKGSTSNTSWNNTAAHQFLDSPATTSQILYRMQVNGHDSSRTIRVNYNFSDGNSNAGDTARTISTMTAIEVRV